MNEAVILSLVDAIATQAVGVKLGRSLGANSLILLEGNLGTGKTTLVQGIAKGLGISESVDSPTFTLINEYTSGRLPLYHLDLYRLNESEIEGLNISLYWEGVEVEPGMVAVEWSERLPYRPADYLQIILSHTPQGDRQIKLIPMGELVIELDGLIDPV
ncbi:tRNA (adenosine(37)-N6)-threonylcarbamoyltransferase complex ATPase subunit type 1 TsaE [Arthrospira platensis]|uniref:tRNA (adenosine(37)-N6)-threonylcarbamoyltransferase complex ATPase subunit type 1 TsaE n=1 Tax=Limnospira platensis TaxID=118562 RepID=UPI0016877CBC|nr:tRNA (adenosine(37)-N6)-threonylcarbamoyltransferase complex ATPase subunit type 1 TsaE [Arthrospira platensis]MBD2572349.1 tRNA (adenosine(37)-N6)-threonylcarbamoyltransferase complex ATPase subunit type 1 TsaE [Arthrospira platensis FACHB-971]